MTKITNKRIDTFLEKHPLGDCLSDAYLKKLFKYMGIKVPECSYYITGNTKLVKRVIQRATTGDPPGIAIFLLKHGNIRSIQWVEKIITTAKVGNPVSAALCLLHYKGANTSANIVWIKTVVEENISKMPQDALYVTVQLYRDSIVDDLEWVMDCIDKCQDIQVKVSAANKLYNYNDQISKIWLQKLLSNAYENNVINYATITLSRKLACTSGYYERWLNRTIKKYAKRKINNTNFIAVFYQELIYAAINSEHSELREIICRINEKIT